MVHRILIGRHLGSWIGLGRIKFPEASRILITLTLFINLVDYLTVMFFRKNVWTIFMALTLFLLDLFLGFMVFVTMKSVFFYNVY